MIAELGRALRLHRATETSGAGAPKKPGPPACVCECGRRIRVAPSVLEVGPITCGVCGADFAPESRPDDDAAGAEPDPVEHRWHWVERWPVATVGMTEFFAGAGGTSQGAAVVPGLRQVLAANHSQVAMATHAANFPDVDHDVADLSQVVPRCYRRTH